MCDDVELCDDAVLTAELETLIDDQEIEESELSPILTYIGNRKMYTWWLFPESLLNEHFLSFSKILNGLTFYLVLIASQNLNFSPGVSITPLKEICVLNQFWQQVVGYALYWKNPKKSSTQNCMWTVSSSKKLYARNMFKVKMWIVCVVCDSMCGYATTFCVTMCLAYQYVVNIKT